ncbi:ParA family protein [Candidatus Hodarchaeum mangrovi]
MHTIAWHSYRGGVGKSLLAVNTAVMLAQLHKKVIIVDFDLRAPSLQTYFQSYSENLAFNMNKSSFTDFLIGNSSPEDVIQKTEFGNLEFVLSDIEVLQKTSKIRTKLSQSGEGKFLTKLFEFIRYCNKKNYDYLFIDCMPGVTFRSLDALVAADQIIVVTRPVKSEIKGLELMKSECYSKLEGARLTAVMNQVETVNDLNHKPSEHDIFIANENIGKISSVLKENPSIPILYTFYRIPFVTERIYITEEPNHPFSQFIKEFCDQNFKQWEMS